MGSDCASGFCADSGSRRSFRPFPTVAMRRKLRSPSRRSSRASARSAPRPTRLAWRIPRYLCETNLQNDDENCGACGNSCGNFEAINMGSRCVKGACAFECLPDGRATDGYMEFRNCNNLIDDGCEINITEDPANCGACGNACAAGVRCINGRCGCPRPAMTDCNGSCRDTRCDNDNCGACGNRCGPTPNACNPLTPNTQYGCVDSVCSKVKCKQRLRRLQSRPRQGLHRQGLSQRRLRDGPRQPRSEQLRRVRREVRFRGRNAATTAPARNASSPCAKANLTECLSASHVCRSPQRSRQLRHVRQRLSRPRATTRYLRAPRASVSWSAWRASPTATATRPTAARSSLSMEPRELRIVRACV